MAAFFWRCYVILANVFCILLGRDRLSKEISVLSVGSVTYTSCHIPPPKLPAQSWSRHDFFLVILAVLCHFASGGHSPFSKRLNTHHVLGLGYNMYCKVFHQELQPPHAPSQETSCLMRFNTSSLTSRRLLRHHSFLPMTLFLLYRYNVWCPRKDFIICEVFPTGGAECIDRAPTEGRTGPQRDNLPPILEVLDVTMEGGWTTVTFLRERETLDSQDYDIF